MIFSLSSLPATAALSTTSPILSPKAPTLGYEVDRFAGRYALGKNLPQVKAKSGFKFSRYDGEVRVLGGACSEVLGGRNLAELLKSGYELEESAMNALRRGEPAPALSVHTSCGVPEAMDRFLDALAPHVPTKTGDWCVNLQAEGASAVHAAIDMGLQVYQSGEDFTRLDARIQVACGASSYHGPASTSPGGGVPLGARAKGLTHPVRYPVPSPFLRRRGEDDASFHGRMLQEFEAYLDMYEHEVGLLLIEPQWGSSVAAMPWPPKLLKAYIAAAKSRGIAVVCDEIMCGLGRHGQAPGVGGTGCFLADCWDLQPDIVTFGKSIGGGAGHLLSGAILLDGASSLQSQRGGTALQSHTYAGSSARALSNGATLLEQLESWRPSVNAIGAAIDPIVQELNEASEGSVIAHGQGALWGGLFAHRDPKARTVANLDFKKRCAEAMVLPYFVPIGGFMLTPRYDDDPEALGAAVKDMAQCALETAREMGWAKSALLPIEGPPPAVVKPAERFKGPSPESMDDAQKVVYDEIERTRTTGVARGPFAPWLASAPLADAAQNFGRAVRYETSLSQKEVEIAILATAYVYRSATEWSIHVGEARAAGLAEEHIKALAKGAVPSFESGSKEAAVYAIASDLLAHKKVSDANYADGVSTLGEKGVVELVSLVGHYGTVALMDNTFQTVDPEMAADANQKAPWVTDAGDA